MNIRPDLIPSSVNDGSIKILSLGIFDTSFEEITANELNSSLISNLHLYETFFVFSLFKREQLAYIGSFRYITPSIKGITSNIISAISFSGILFNP